MLGGVSWVVGLLLGVKVGVFGEMGGMEVVEGINHSFLVLVIFFA